VAKQADKPAEEKSATTAAKPKTAKKPKTAGKESK
jgi:hypothetical protein